MSTGQQRVAAYLRVSSEEQKQRQTIATQRDYAERHCFKHDIAPVTYYADDGVSGTIPIDQRPDGVRLIRDARAGAFSTLLVYRLDRLGRDALVTLSAIDALERAGVEIVSMTQNLDLKTPHGRFMAVIDCGVAGYERESIIERGVEGSNRVARDGGWLGGKPPYGYLLVGRGREGRLMVSDALIPGVGLSEADVVRLIYRKLADEELSCRIIADYLNARGIPTAYMRGDRRSITTTKGLPASGKWTSTRVRHLAAQTTYRGVHQYNKHGKSGRAVVEREAPPIVSPEMWHRAQAVMHRNMIYAQRNTQNQYLLRGLIKCALCGMTYLGSTEQQGRYVYYKCGGKQHGRGPQLALGHKCPSKPLRAREIERDVWADIDEWRHRPETATLALEEQIRAHGDEGADLQQDAERVQRMLARVSAERDVVLTLFRKGRIDERALDQQLDAIDAEERKLQGDLDTLTRRLREAGEMVAQLRGVEEMLREWHRLIGENPTFEQKRKLVEALVEGIRVETVEEDGKPEAVVHIRYHFEVANTSACRPTPRTSRRATG
ncbi:MAG: recombinase family protein [Chloroflexota bacterium]|nr:recombinase family protein [Chloroflexota bacterium]